MADHDHSMRGRLPPENLVGNGMGAGLVWVLAAVAGLGILVLVGALGGGVTPVAPPGGAGADPVALLPAASPAPPDGAVPVD